MEFEWRLDVGCGERRWHDDGGASYPAIMIRIPAVSLTAPAKIREAHSRVPAKNKSLLSLSQRETIQ